MQHRRADVAFYSGNQVDYNIRPEPNEFLNEFLPNSWVISHVRGARTDGTDTLVNTERAYFEGDKTFADLRTNGVPVQRDFGLVIDTTGSMGPYIGAVKSQAAQLINALLAGGANDARIGVIDFKDPEQGDPNTVTLRFTDQDDLAARQRAAVVAVNGLSASGGGDRPEAAYSGLLAALDGSMGDWRTSSAVRRIALFTDAPVKDVELADTVNRYAADIGATVERSASLALTAGRMDAFTLTAAVAATEEAPGSDAPASTITPARVEIYTILVGNPASDPYGAIPGLRKIASDNGGQFLEAPTPGDLVATLLSIITRPPVPIIQLAATEIAKVEGDAGVRAFDFTVTRVGDLSAGSSVAYAVRGADPEDFDGGARPSGRVSFAAGQESAIVTVRVAGDRDLEPDEAFTLQLQGAVNGTIDQATARGVILDDDLDQPAIELSIRTITAQAREGNAGNTPFIFEAMRSGDAKKALSVLYQVSPSRGADASDFVDEIGREQSLAFAPDQATARITVGVRGDVDVEADEAFLVRLLRGPSNSGTAAEAEARILDDDVIVVSPRTLGAAGGYSRSNPDAWRDAWLRDGVSIRHRANGDDAEQAWQPANFGTFGPGTYGGSDIADGDLGVAGRAGGTQTLAQELDGSEALRFDFAAADVSVLDFGFENFDAGDRARINAYDADGAVIGSVVSDAAAARLDGLMGSLAYAVIRAEQGSFSIDKLTFG